MPLGPDEKQDIESVEARFEQLKDDFLSAVGHELRTPLTAIQGTLKLLQGGVVDPGSEKGRRLISMAVSNGDRLQKMVEGLLDVNRLKTGRMTLQKEQCELGAVVKAVVERVESRAGHRTIHTDLEAGRLWADPVRLADVLEKLLDNAVRYSPEESEIFLAIKRQGSHMLFSVQDQGVGLAPEDADRIFEDFGQLDRSDTRQTGGAGLSLAICRHVVRQHGGRIWVESKPGAGSCFYFLLPAPQEQALLDNAHSFRQWVEHVRDVFWLADVQHNKLSYVSKAVEDVSGRPPETFYAAPDSWLEAVHPDDRGLVRPLCDPNPPPRAVYRVQRPDGALRWVKDRRYTVRNEFGVLESVVGIAEDITEQHLALEELRVLNHELERRVIKRSSEFAAIFNCNPEAIVFTDLERRIVMCNPAFTGLFGYRPEEVVGKSVRVLYKSDEDFAEQGRLRFNQQASKAPAAFELLYRLRDGSDMPTEVVATRVFALDGTSLGYLAIIRDLRPRRRLEEQVRQSERIATIGQLADGIAHDFNNLLTIVSGNTGLLREAVPPGDCQDLVAEIARAVDRGTALTGQLLSFSRPRAGQPETLDLNQVVQQNRNLLRCVLGEKFDIRVETGRPAALVRAELFQLQQLLMQLLLNARDSMPGGGTVHIRVTLLVLRETQPTMTGELLPGNYVGLAISDNGAGLNAETVRGMFQHGGALNTVGRTVQDLQGGVLVQSGPGLGTTFQVYVPNHARGAEAAPVPLSSAERRQTVLLVEDDAGVRRLVCRVLRQEGYTVLEAVNGQEGLEVLQKTPDAIDLVVTDVVMPKLSGEELAEEVRRLHPDARILLMSGYRDERTARPDVHFVPKPLIIPDFIAKVRDLLSPLSRGAGGTPSAAAQGTI